jgi:hypothetical protein
LAVVDRLFPSNPSPPFIVGRTHDEERVELRQGGPDLTVVVGFAPAGKPLSGGLEEPGPGLIEKRVHGQRSEKQKSLNQKLKSWNAEMLKLERAKADMLKH